MGVLPQALKIVFEVKKKGVMKNNKKRNKLSNLQNTFSPFLSSLDPSYFQTS